MIITKITVKLMVDPEVVLTPLLDIKIKIRTFTTALRILDISITVVSTIRERKTGNLN